MISNLENAIVIDNVLPIDYFNYVKSRVQDNSKFPWNYFPLGGRDKLIEPDYPFFYDHKTKCFSKENKYEKSFDHLAVRDGISLTEYGDLGKEILNKIADIINLKLKYIFRVRYGLILPNEDGNIINHPHVDTEHEHLVGLLYLTTSNGETVLYDQTYDYSTVENKRSVHTCKEIMQNGGFTVREKIKSVENRFVIFQGWRFHSSTCPTDVEERMTINFNFSLV
jgi:hypothetical protein